MASGIGTGNILAACTDHGGGEYSVHVFGTKQKDVAGGGTLTLNPTKSLRHLIIDIDAPAGDAQPFFSLSVVADAFGSSFTFAGVRRVTETGSARVALSITGAEQLGDPAGSPSTNVIQCDRFDDIQAVKVGGIPGSGNSYATIIADYAGTDAHAITSLLVGNDLLGDVEALNGRISHIDVAGDIGDESAGIRPTIAAYQLIGVEAASIHADIMTADTTGARTLRIVSESGDLSGSVFLRHLDDAVGTGSPVTDPRVSVAGDCDADIEIALNAEAPIEIDGELPANRTIEIGRHLQDDITIGANGLKGQIIINEDNLNQQWQADVTVGTTTLSPVPFYAQSKDSLGGGSVGLVPFNYHGVDCEPEHLTVVCDWDGEITMEFYGPITVEETDYGTYGLPVIVERVRSDYQVGCIPELGHNCDPCDPDSVFPPTNWVDVTDQFTFQLHPNGNVRQCRLTASVSTGPCSGSRYLQYLYRVRPRDIEANPSETNWLRSDVAASGAINPNPLVFIPAWDPELNWACSEADDNYRFYVDFRTSNLDLSENGLVDGADLGAWSLDEPDLDADGDGDLTDAQYIIDNQGEPGVD